MDSTALEITAAHVELFAAGDEITAHCRLCGGKLTRPTPPPPARGDDDPPAGWLLWDLLDAMSYHMRGNNHV